MVDYEVAENFYLALSVRLNTSYRQILSISTHYVRSAAQKYHCNLCDNVFSIPIIILDFAAAGLVGVFYLMHSIGYGFLEEDKSS